jgi:hypothetical protein
VFRDYDSQKTFQDAEVCFPADLLAKRGDAASPSFSILKNHSDFRVGFTRKEPAAVDGRRGRDATLRAEPSATLRRATLPRVFKKMDDNSKK